MPKLALNTPRINVKLEVKIYVKIGSTGLLSADKVPIMIREPRNPNPKTRHKMINSIPVTEGGRLLGGSADGGPPELGSSPSPTTSGGFAINGVALYLKSS